MAREGPRRCRAVRPPCAPHPLRAHPSRTVAPIPVPRGSAKSVAGCLMFGVFGVLTGVRRDPHGNDEGIYSIPSLARSRRRCHLPPQPPPRAGP